MPPITGKHLLRMNGRKFGAGAWGHKQPPPLLFFRRRPDVLNFLNKLRHSLFIEAFLNQPIESKKSCQGSQPNNKLI